MDEKRGSSAGRGGAGGAGRADRPYEDSFERAIDEFERANALESEFDDPEGWARENPDYWIGAANRAEDAARESRSRSMTGRLGGLWPKPANVPEASPRDGDGWPSTRLTFGESARDSGSATRPQASWRDAAWELPALEEAKLGRISRRIGELWDRLLGVDRGIGELWDRLLGVDRGMSRLEEAARKRRGKTTWPRLLDDGEDLSASIRPATAAQTSSKPPYLSAAPLGSPMTSPSSRPIVPVARELGRHPRPTGFRLDRDWDRPPDGVALPGRRVSPSIAKEELSAFFDLARDKARGAQERLNSDPSRRGPRP